eukprot:m.163124 g.163124  ORF g.163124 m.163124 type:complete len:80 (-) comp16388_c0_seq83:519-758(-)
MLLSCMRSCFCLISKHVSLYSTHLMKGSWNNTETRVLKVSSKITSLVAFHGVSFAGAGLTIGKDSAVEACQDFIQQRLN